MAMLNNQKMMQMLKEQYRTNFTKRDPDSGPGDKNATRAHWGYHQTERTGNPDVDGGDGIVEIDAKVLKR
jgi:hypothetical protein